MTNSGHDDAPRVDQDIEGRLRVLKKDIAAERSRLNDGPRAKDSTALAAGMKGATEFVGAVLVGGAIGLGIDHLAGTRPLFTIALFLLGVVAGLLGLVRSVTPKVQK
jgi:ATP synthase protein I